MDNKVRLAVHSLQDLGISEKRLCDINVYKRFVVCGVPPAIQHLSFTPVCGELRLHHEEPFLPRPQRSPGSREVPGPVLSSGSGLHGDSQEEEGRRWLLRWQES